MAGDTALVTGATSGIGYTASILLAEAGYTHVTVAGRTNPTAKATELAQRSQRDIFDAVELDLFDPCSIKEAVTQVVRLGRKIDFLLLNAGMVSGAKLTRTEEGVEVTFASSLIGHHRLTVDLLNRGALSKRAQIVISGSEAARGEVTGFETVDLKALAKTRFNNDCVAAAIWLIQNGTSPEFQPGQTYSNAKLFVAWWAAALARRLPPGITVNAVSPGKASGTGIQRNGAFLTRCVVVPLSRIAARFGRETGITEAATRYLTVAGYEEEVNGAFFASAPGQMTGPLQRDDFAYLNDLSCQEAAWKAIVSVSKTDDLCDTFLTPSTTKR